MSWTSDEAYDAMQRVEQLLDDRNSLILRCYRTGHGPVTREERQRFADLADEISRLYGELSEYYRQQADHEQGRT